MKVNAHASYAYTVSQKNIPDTFDCHLKTSLSDFDNFWYQYSGHNLPSNDHSVSYLSHCPLLRYLGKADQVKYTLK